MTKSVHVLIHECRGYELAHNNEAAENAGYVFISQGMKDTYQSFNRTRDKIAAALPTVPRGSMLPGEISLLEKWGLR